MDVAASSRLITFVVIHLVLLSSIGCYAVLCFRKLCLHSGVNYYPQMMLYPVAGGFYRNMCILSCMESDLYRLVVINF